MINILERLKKIIEILWEIFVYYIFLVIVIIVVIVTHVTHIFLFPLGGVVLIGAITIVSIIHFSEYLKERRK